ncbi:MAG: hypothetical protein ACD_78C00300G0005 [uncultured bacterium (gcode 4)]|uniref:Uncharacterized protein n=1 Tax=uncultured bacterium (gcode 4) TaxID=1234023 RepID=K1YBL2_9BACT|nr:MAG: hypothetical protein ACD_78C00300G0005 [uncultured bacterium (gcode 4)]
MKQAVFLNAREIWQYLEGYVTKQYPEKVDHWGVRWSLYASGGIPSYIDPVFVLLTRYPYPNTTLQNTLDIFENILWYLCEPLQKIELYTYSRGAWDFFLFRFWRRILTCSSISWAVAASISSIEYVFLLINITIINTISLSVIIPFSIYLQIFSPNSYLFSKRPILLSSSSICFCCSFTASISGATRLP